MLAKYKVALTVVGLLLAGAVIGVLVMRESDSSVSSASTTTVTTLRTQNQSFKLEVADEPAEQSLGLGQRDSLSADRGMLFVYSEEGDRCFWMQDMRFAIDMIWLDSNKTVVDVAADVKPDTYPQNFCPKQPAQYVIELNANDAAKHGISVGQRLDF